MNCFGRNSLGHHGHVCMTVIQLIPQCRLMAPLRHADRPRERPLVGEDREVNGARSERRE